MSAVGGLGGAPLTQDSAPSSAFSVWLKPGTHRASSPVHSWTSWDMQVDLWKCSLQVPTAEKDVNSGILNFTVKLFLIIKRNTWNLKGKAYLPTVSPAQKFTDKLFFTARIFHKSMFSLLNSYVHPLLPRTVIRTGCCLHLELCCPSPSRSPQPENIDANLTFPFQWPWGSNVKNNFLPDWILLLCYEYTTNQNESVIWISMNT